MNTNYAQACQEILELRLEEGSVLRDSKDMDRLTYQLTESDILPEDMRVGDFIHGCMEPQFKSISYQFMPSERKAKK
ncbi:hypothetical protein LCGC14_2085300 [marine sediment metagenome]|uniref:Uncharacterized protein n=1 Tax=marine sediment metagenome TaxID=412755 RepID=A0A0F9EEL9_9ZZZZ